MLGYNLNVETELNNVRIRVFKHVLDSNHDDNDGGCLKLVLDMKVQRAPFSTRLCSGTSDMRHDAKYCFHPCHITIFEVWLKLKNGAPHFILFENCIFTAAAC